MPEAGPDRPRPSRAAVAALALGFTLFTAARTPWSGGPIDNEALYLLAAWKWWRPEFLANDWTFAVPWREHALFNSAAGLLSLALPLDPFTWALRLGGWFAVYATLLGLFRRLAVPWWAALAGIVAWKAGGQALVGGEWMIGGAEAKVFAYAALFAALSAFLDHRDLAGGFLLGLCVSLHPAVGVGAGVGTGVALLAVRTPWRRLALAGGAALAAALPGIVAAAGVSRGTAGAGSTAWEFIVLARLPHHLDPFRFDRYGQLCVLALAVLLGLLTIRWRADRATRFLVAFVAGTGLLYLAGFLARAAGAWAFLQLYPFRLAPLVLPLFVPALLLAELARRWTDPPARRPLVLALGAALAVILVRVDRMDGAGSVPATIGVEPGRSESEDRRAAQAWVADSTAPDAVVLAYPGSKRAFWDFRRAQVVNWWALRYDRFGEWRARIDALAGPIDPSGPVEQSLLEERFEALPTDSVLALGRRYGATFLVTRAPHPLPLRFRAGAVTVYALPAGDSLSPLPHSP